MFCQKCGYRLFDTEERCPRCGWIRPLNNNGEAPPQNRPRNKYNSSVPNYDNQPREYYSDDKLIPAAYRRGASNPPKQKNRANRALIVTVAVVCTVVLIVSGLLIFMLFYHNSDDYKTGQAIEKIAAGEYKEGLGYIRGVKTSQADVIRDFTQVLQERQKFSEAFNPDSLQDDDAVKAAYNRLNDSFLSFKTADKLPDELKSLYEKYSGRVAVMNTVLIDSRAQNISDAQQCVLAYKRRKEGANFTKGNIEDVINVSEPAVKALETMINSAEYQQMKQGCPCQAVRTMDELFQITSAQVAQDKHVLSNDLKGKAPDASLKISNTYDFYNANVGTGLMSVTGESDLTENAQKLFMALRYAWTAYCFEIDN